MSSTPTAALSRGSLFAVLVQMLMQMLDRKDIFALAACPIDRPARKRPSPMHACAVLASAAPLVCSLDVFAYTECALVFNSGAMKPHEACMVRIAERGRVKKRDFARLPV